MCVSLLCLNMQIVNNRILINENEINMDLLRVETIVRGYMYSIGHPDSEVETYFDSNEELGKFWNELVINIFHSNNNQSCIIFATELFCPTLVCENGELKFYYVFDFGNHTLTEPYTLENGEIPYDMSLESQIIQHLNKTLNSSSVTITLSEVS